jgi:hypothetical protein
MQLGDRRQLFQLGIQFCELRVEPAEDSLGSSVGRRWLASSTFVISDRVSLSSTIAGSQSARSRPNGLAQTLL